MKALVCIALLLSLSSCGETYCDPALTSPQIYFEGYEDSELQGLSVVVFQAPNLVPIDSQSPPPYQIGSGVYQLGYYLGADRGRTFRIRLPSGEQHLLNGFTYDRHICQDNLFSADTYYESLSGYSLDGVRYQGEQASEVRIRK